MKFATWTRPRRDAGTRRRPALRRRPAVPPAAAPRRTSARLAALGRAIFVATIATVFAAAPAARPAPSVVRGAPRRFLVHFEDVVRNEGDAPLRDVVCDALLPLEMPRQHVRWMRLSPHGWTIRRDVHGQTVATARVASIPPGGAECFSWIASVDLAAEDHAPYGALDADVPPAARRYLADHPKLGVTSDAVRRAANEARRRADGAMPLALAESAADVVRERVRYEIDGTWDAAPDVLARGTGSCSESVFAYVAICRALGLPARWTGGTLLRSGPAGRTCDVTFHRVAEVWLPLHGWRPVETEAQPTGAVRASGPLARTEPRAVGSGFLLLARGDASGGTRDDPSGASLLGDAYHARERWAPLAGGQGPRAAPRVTKRAFWLAGVDDDLALRGSDAGLSEDAHPSFPRGELIACDARGFGPPLQADGSPLTGGMQDSARGASRSAADAARVLIDAGHPEGLRLAAEACDGAGAAATLARAAARCDDELADSYLEVAGGSRAAFEAWWAASVTRIVPAGSRRLTLVPVRRAPTRSP